MSPKLFCLKLALIIGLLLASSCQSLRERAPRTAWAGGRYTVRKGDTVYSIARKRKVDTFEILEANGIVNAANLELGQVLYIPEHASHKLGSNKSRHSKRSHQAKIIKPNSTNKTDFNLDWPVKNGVLLKTFNSNPGKLHEGVAIAAPKNTPVTAAQSGEVIYVGDDGTHYGRLVIIRHEDPFVTIYGHLDEIFITKGQKININDPIGTVGITGGVDSPRVYLQLRKDRQPVDPEPYLKH